MKKSNMPNTIEELRAVENVRNAFPMGQTTYMGCVVNITYIAEAHKYETKTGKMSTKSTRYFGTVKTTEGEKINLLKTNKAICGRLKTDANNNLVWNMGGFDSLPRFKS